MQGIKAGPTLEMLGESFQKLNRRCLDSDDYCSNVSFMEMKTVVTQLMMCLMIYLAYPMIRLPNTVPIPAPDPATPTVAAPAPMNLAAVSMSRLTELVWNPRTATACSWDIAALCGARSVAVWSEQYRSKVSIK